MSQPQALGTKQVAKTPTTPKKPSAVYLHAQASYANDWASGWKCRTPNPFHTTNEVRLANEWREAYDAALREHELSLQRQKAKEQSNEQV